MILVFINLDNGWIVKMIIVYKKLICYFYKRLRVVVFGIDN